METKDWKRVINKFNDVEQGEFFAGIIFDDYNRIVKVFVDRPGKRDGGCAGIQEEIYLFDFQAMDSADLYVKLLELKAETLKDENEYPISGAENLKWLWETDMNEEQAKKVNELVEELKKGFSEDTETSDEPEQKLDFEQTMKKFTEAVDAIAKAGAELTKTMRECNAFLAAEMERRKTLDKMESETARIIRRQI